MLTVTRANTKYLIVGVILSAMAITAMATGILLLRQELNATRSVLEFTHSQLTQAEITLQTTQTSLKEVEALLAGTQDSLEITAVALDIVTERANSFETALSNLEANYQRLTAGYGYAVRDPTYDMVMGFLEADPTIDRRYDIDNYNCTDFSADVKANAAREGIRCAYVNIYFPNLLGHAIVAFNTTDKGLIFIEPQTGGEVDLRVGRSYYESLILESGQSYFRPDYDDTVVRYSLIW